MKRAGSRTLIRSEWISFFLKAVYLASKHMPASITGKSNALTQTLILDSAIKCLKQTMEIEELL